MKKEAFLRGQHQNLSQYKATNSAKVQKAVLQLLETFGIVTELP